MRDDLRFVPGVAPDVAIREGVVHLVYGPKPWTWLALSLDGEVLARREQPVGYYPKTNGVVSVAHDGEQFISWGPASLITIPVGRPVGVHATGISPNGTAFFYGTTPLPNPYASYGLWECFDDGTCKTWDECYYVAKPAGAGQTHHSADGRLWARECATGGIEGAVDGTPFLLWPGTTTMWPRCASDGTHVVLASWSGVGPTVRVWIGTLAELAALGVPETPAVPQAVAPFAEHFWAGCYKDPAQFGPHNVTFGPEPLLGSVMPPAIVAEPPADLSRVVGWTVTIEGALPIVSTTARALKAVKDAPVYAYLGSYVPETRIDGVDYPVIQAYRLPGCETSAAILAKLRTDLARCAYPRVALAVDLTARTLADGVPWSEQDRVAFLLGIADVCRAIRPAAVFAWAWDRNAPQAGISSSPVITEQWRRFVAAIPFTTGGSPHTMSTHLDTVQAERAKYPAPEYGLNDQGERVLLNPMGNDNAARISRAVAWAHRDEGWGLLDKPSGNNVLGYSVDVIINARERQIVDVLGSSEAECIPVWNVIEWREDYAARWRPPLDPDTLLPAPDGSDLEARVRVLDTQVARILDWIGGF